jgi:endoglucanase
MIYPRFGRLAVQNGQLRGEDGRPAVLRGMSLFWSQWGGQYYRRATIDRLVDDWCVDVVRAPLAVEPDGYLVDPATQMDRVSAVVLAAAARGIYVIIDWHSHLPHTDAAITAFNELARRHGQLPHVLWEPWNEPEANARWGSNIVPHHLRLIDMLRNGDAMGVVICGTPHYCQDFAAPMADPVRRTDVAYALHFYAASHGAAVREVAERASNAALCLFASEYGLGEANGDGALDLDETYRWWRFLERREISHVNWSLFDKHETCAALISPSLFGRWRLSPSGRAVRTMLRSWRRESHD